jgi:hypothetical protein
VSGREARIWKIISGMVAQDENDLRKSSREFDIGWIGDAGKENRVRLHGCIK